MYRINSEMIKNIPLLKCYSNYNAVIKLVHILYPFYVNKGECLIVQGEIAAQIFVLVNGLVF